MKKIFYAILILSLFSCKVKEMKEVEKVFEDGTPELVATYVGDGDAKYKIKEIKYYADGKIEMEAYYNKKGGKSGLWKYWYKNGKLWSEGEYKNNQRNGLSIVYYKNGGKRYKGQYTKGKPSGHWVFWLENGSKANEKDY